MEKQDADLESDLDPGRRDRAERFRVLLWRAEVLIEAGYPPDHAAELARDDSVDVRRAVALVRAGVNPGAAARRLSDHEPR